MEKQIQDQLNRIENILKDQREKPLTFIEAAHYTGLSKSYLYKMTHFKKIPFFRPSGKMIYFLKQDLDAYLLKNRIESNENIDSQAINHLTGKGAI